MFSEEIIPFKSSDDSLSKLFNPSNDEWITIDGTKELTLSNDVINGSFIRSIRVILDRTPNNSEINIILSGIIEGESEVNLINLSNSSDFNNRVLINKLENNFTKLKISITSKSEIKFKNILLELLTEDYNRLGFMVDDKLLVQRDNVVIKDIEFNKDNLKKYGNLNKMIKLYDCNNKGLVFKKEKEDDDNVYYVCKINSEEINEFIKIQGDALSDRTDCSIVVINTQEKNSILTESLKNNKNIFPVLLTKNDLIKNIKIYYSKKGDE